MSQVARLIAVVAFLFIFRNEAVEVDIRGEVRHVLAEIVVGVYFKDFYLHLLYIFDIYVYLYLVIYIERGLVVLTYLDVCCTLQLLDDVFCSVVIINL